MNVGVDLHNTKRVRKKERDKEITIKEGKERFGTSYISALHSRCRWQSVKLLHHIVPLSKVLGVLTLRVMALCPFRETLALDTSVRNTMRTRTCSIFFKKSKQRDESQWTSQNNRNIIERKTKKKPQRSYSILWVFLWIKMATINFFK